GSVGCFHFWRCCQFWQLCQFWSVVRAGQFVCNPNNGTGQEDGVVPPAGSHTRIAPAPRVPHCPNGTRGAVTAVPCSAPGTGASRERSGRGGRGAGVTGSGGDESPAASRAFGPPGASMATSSTAASAGRSACSRE